MPAKHAKLSCSGAARWLNCPGSVKLSGLYPATSSPYTMEGTIAHAMLEAGIKDSGEFRAVLEQAEAFYREHPELDGSAKAMQDTIEDMLTWILAEYEKERKEDPAVSIYSEQQVDLSGYIPGGFGTADVTIARTGFLHIIDLKYGKGVEVSAVENPQLRLYALGMLEMLDMIYDVKDIRMTIYQPRIGNISSDAITADALREWGRTVVKPAAELAISDGAPFAAGEWCRFCPARRECRTRAGENLALEKYKRKTLLSNDEIGEILKAVDEMVKWANDLKTGALDKLEAGEVIPGWKVVAGRSVRQFSESATEDTIVAAAEKAGFKKPLLYETKMLSLSAIEKLMGKKVFAQALGEYVVKPEGKPTLAPESDKRPSLTQAKAADVFADDLQDDGAIPFT